MKCSQASLRLGRAVDLRGQGVLAGVFDHVCNCRKPARSGRRPERRGTLLVRLVFVQNHILDRSRVLVGLGCGRVWCRMLDVCGLGDGRNGDGESWQWFAHGEVRSAGAKYAGTAGEAVSRANGFNHIDGLQSRSFWAGLWLRFSAHVDNCRKPGGRTTSSGTAGEVCPSGW